MVNKSIFAKVTICFMASSLHLILSLSLPLSLCLVFSLFLLFPALCLLLRLQVFSRGMPVTGLDALSAFSGRRPDCTATGGCITDFSGQAAGTRPCAPTEMGPQLLQPAAVGLVPACHPLRNTHTNTQAATVQANTHPLLSAVPPVQERTLSQCLY